MKSEKCINIPSANVNLCEMTVFLRSQSICRLKVALIVALIVMATSCSFKTLYNRLDYLIPSYVEGLVSLDSMLEEKVEQRSLILISWHRNSQLNQYADWLRALQRDANHQLTEERVLQHIITLEGFWKSITLRINEEMVILLPLLNAEQRQELFASIADRNEDFHDDYIDVDNDERIEQYVDRMLDNYEKWLGDLTDDQEVAVEQAASELLTGAQLRLQRRQQWQRSIQNILDTSDSATHKAERLREFFAGFDIDDNVAMKNIGNTNKHIIARLTVQIVHSMTEEQKAHFVSRTNDYIRMFTELAEER